MEFDARPLTEPVHSHDVKQFTQQLKAAGHGGSVGGMIAGVAIAAVLFGILAFFAVLFSVILGTFAMADPALGGLPFLPLVLLVVGSVGGGLLLWRSSVKTNERRYRLDRFARANHMSYYPTVRQPPLSGMIFSVGSERKATDLVRGEQPRFVEFANYTYTTGSGKNKTTHKWGYVAVKLDVPLPHIVLDALGNNGLFGASNLPAAFTKDQRLSLEGDFDRHFALYCPTGYERDALYLFTPDIMARFVDHAAALDVEIVDDWLFLYAKRDFSTLDPRTWAWLFGTIRALLEKFEQWARWRDERLLVAHGPGAIAHLPNHELPFAAPVGMLAPPPGVAQEGQRLRRRFSWAVLIPVAAIVIWVLARVAEGFFRIF